MNATNASFPKEARLKRSLEFLHVFKKGRSVRESGIALYFQKNQTPSKNRIGIVVSRKALSRAVDRNRAKRVTRDFFRTASDGLKQGYDVVVRFVNPSKSFSNKDLRMTLQNLFKQADLYL